MSTHPNVILMAVLTPDDLPMRTMRAICSEHGIEYDRDGDDIKIGSEDYNLLVMEDDYDDGFQISAKEGDLIFFDMVTYGYGEVISWTDLEKQKNELEAWARETCKKHNCAYSIRVTANYW